MTRHHVMLPGERRKRDLRAIHAGARQLNLDEETRRGLIERITGLRSAGDLDDAGRAAVIEELRRLGAGGKPGRHRGKPRNMDARPMLTRIEQLLPAIHATQKKLAAKHGDKDVWLFHSVFIARYTGFVCATFGVDGALSLLEGMVRVAREATTHHGKVH